MLSLLSKHSLSCNFSRLQEVPQICEIMSTVKRTAPYARNIPYKFTLSSDLVNIGFEYGTSSTSFDCSLIISVLPRQLLLPFIPKRQQMFDRIVHRPVRGSTYWNLTVRRWQKRPCKWNNTAREKISLKYKNGSLVYLLIGRVLKSIVNGSLCNFLRSK